MTRAAREALLDLLIRSVADIRHLAALLADAGYSGLASELRRKLSERPAITGVPKLDPSLWGKGAL
jgi:hypothetical protein